MGGRGNRHNDALGGVGATNLQRQSLGRVKVASDVTAAIWRAPEERILRPSGRVGLRLRPFGTMTGGGWMIRSSKTGLTLRSS